MFVISFTTLAVITAALTAFYYYLTKNFNYWSSRGVNGPKPVVLFGNIWELFVKRFQLIEEDRLAKYGSIYGLWMLKHITYLRMYGPAPITSRVPSQDNKLGNTGITVEKGTTIIIPIHALHHSPDYFPEPKQYRPERFLPENRDKIIPYTYLPFGAGPRNCVGMRFALMEAKAVVARMVIKYEFIRTANTKVPLQYVSKSSIPRPTDFTVGVHYRSKIG